MNLRMHPIIVHALQVLDSKLLSSLHLLIMNTKGNQKMHGPAEGFHGGTSCSQSEAPPARRMHVPIRSTAGNKLRL